jgi:hypothetical protein
MPGQNNSLINLGDLAEPAKVLVEKVSDAVGGLFKPYQIKRVAKAEAEADIIKATTQIEISELQKRAINRFLVEEATKQENIESITEKAIPQLEEGSNPGGIEKDWLVDFFDKSRIVSDEEMQNLWSAILAGEANKPGSYSKRTLHLMASLDKKDAVLFTKLCRFVWTARTPVPLIFDIENDIYAKNGINFSILKHLDAIGLISFESLSGYVHKGFGKNAVVSYGKKITTLEFQNDNNQNNLSIGHVLFTDVGMQLAQFCQGPVIDGFEKYVMSQWLKDGIKDANRIMYKGTIIDNSLSNKEILKKVRINKTWQDGDWTLHSIFLDEDQIAELASALDNGSWYIHIWKQGEDDVKVIYRDKIFDIKFSDKSTWLDAVKYGKSLGIPEAQLDFPIN